MKIPISDELRGICRRIAAEARTEAEWAAHESSDAFQTERYAGGFEAVENEFCFSYYPPVGEEQWFQFSLSTAEKIASDQEVELKGRPAE